MNEYTRSNAHTQILRTVKDFPRILELNSPSQKWRAFPEISARLCQPFTVFRSNVPFLNAMARILKLNSEKQKRRPLPGVVRRTFHVLYGDPVQCSVSERFSSYLGVELGLTGPTSISTNIRTTCSKSLAVFVSNDSSLSVRPRILILIFL